MERPPGLLSLRVTDPRLRLIGGFLSDQPSGAAETQHQTGTLEILSALSSSAPGDGAVVSIATDLRLAPEVDPPPGGMVSSQTLATWPAWFESSAMTISSSCRRGQRAFPAVPGFWRLDCRCAVSVSGGLGNGCSAWSTACGSRAGGAAAGC
jgi:hypothetical protein